MSNPPEAKGIQPLVDAGSDEPGTKHMMEAVPRVEHAVILSLRLDEFSRRRLPALIDAITTALSVVAGGECGGSDMSDDYCLVYCYGDDADEVFDAIGPALREFHPAAGSWAIKRFGAADDLNARRQRVELDEGRPASGG